MDNRKAKPRKGGFKTFSLDDRVLRGVRAAGFAEPRPIQARTIPAVLDGRDVLGLAQTGTGKTAAFALPILSLFSERRRRGAGPRALIVAPTRELANQIDDEIALLGEFTSVRSTALFGGVPANKQVRALRRKPDVVVACPGRLLDLHQQREIDLSGVEVLVLDEADHMFDMGFLPSIRKILAALPKRRQNLLFSATMPREIRKLADAVLHRPHVVELANSAPAKTIEHAIYPVEQTRKQEMLERLLDDRDFSSAIVFVRTKHRARRLAQRLGRDGHSVAALQGDMSQGQRDRAMQGFRDGRYDILVATDIAARGIDVDNVSHVINFDVPNTPDAYTHRIGRTCRSERRGKACTFVTHEDRAQVTAIEKQIGSKLPVVVLNGFGGGRRNSVGSAGGREAARAGRDDRPGRAGREGNARREGRAGREGSARPDGSEGRAGREGSTGREGRAGRGRAGSSPGRRRSRSRGRGRQTARG